MELDRVIIYNLIGNEEYARKVVPFLKEEYFRDVPNKIIFNLINNYYQKYSRTPTKEALLIDLEKVSVNQEVFNKVTEVLKNCHADKVDLEWLTDNTESFCKNQAIHNAILKSIEIYDKKESVESIPSILSDAIGVSFDNSVGHNFTEDYEKRFTKYHEKMKRVSFDLKYMNEITCGGIPSKTLTVIMAGVGVGKSLAMSHMASHNLMMGLNVLYITLELSEEVIAQRIEANLLGIEMNDITSLNHLDYVSKLSKLKGKTQGKLVIKEYPTASASVLTFKHLLQELKIKTKFTPDIIYVDYLNICSSARYRNAGGNVNSYNYVKAIAEELRGLAVEYDVPVISATQVTRSGFSNSDFGLEDTSESWGLPQTADVFIALIQPENLATQNLIRVKQLKNRLNDLGKLPSFVIGVDRSRMRLYDVEMDKIQLIPEGEQKEEVKAKFSKFH